MMADETDVIPAAWEAIGGHEGMTVYRTAAGEIAKVADDEFQAAALLNEQARLVELTGCDLFPDPGGAVALTDGRTMTLQADVGEAETPPDGEMLRRAAIRLLSELRARSVRHGDLTGANVRWTGGRLVAFDFAESHPCGGRAAAWSRSTSLSRTRTARRRRRSRRGRTPGCS
jgi:hypothetical protein